jgi:hypothetical protein
VNAYLLIVLSMGVGFVFGWASCMYFWLRRQEAPAKERRETEAFIAAAIGDRSVESAAAPAGLVPAAARALNGRPLSTFYRPPTTFQRSHDCRAEACTDTEGRSRH